MFTTSEVLLTGFVAALLTAGAAFAYQWARQNLRFAVAAGATFLGFIAWNFVISHARATGLDVDAPVVRLSWQDAGSGILAFCATALALGIYERSEPAGKVTLTAAIAGLVSMIWDIFVL
jgi:hypothetical protein